AGAQPSASLPQACGGAAGAKAAYRFLANDGVEAAALVASHVGATHRRGAAGGRGLAVQGTSRGDWPGPGAAGGGLGVRAAQDRGLADPERRLWAAVAAAPVAATAAVAVPRRPGQPAREAVLSVRHRPVTLRPPAHRAAARLPTAPVWAVLAREEDPPAGA